MTVQDYFMKMHPSTTIEVAVFWVGTMCIYSASQPRRQRLQS